MCARGILMTDISLDFVRSAIVEATAEGWADVLNRVEDMQAEGSQWLAEGLIEPARRSFRGVVEARYKGQNFEVQVRLPEDGSTMTLEEFLAGFAVSHKREYGYSVDDRAVEIVNVRLKAIGAVERPATRFTAGEGDAAPVGTRQVHFENGWVETPIYDRGALPVGVTIAGPAIVNEMSSTTVVDPGQTFRIDPQGNLILEIAA